MNIKCGFFKMTQCGVVFAYLVSFSVCGVADGVKDAPSGYYIAIGTCDQNSYPDHRMPFVTFSGVDTSKPGLCQAYKGCLETEKTLRVDINFYTEQTSPGRDIYVRSACVCVETPDADHTIDDMGGYLTIKDNDKTHPGYGEYQIQDARYNPEWNVMELSTGKWKQLRLGQFDPKNHKQYFLYGKELPVICTVPAAGLAYEAYIYNRTLLDDVDYCHSFSGQNILVTSGLNKYPVFPGDKLQVCARNGGGPDGLDCVASPLITVVDYVPEGIQNAVPVGGRISPWGYQFSRQFAIQFPKRNDKNPICPLSL